VISSGRQQFISEGSNPVGYLQERLSASDCLLPFYVDILGGKLTDRYTSNAPGVEVHVAAIEVKGVHVELLEPTNRESPLPVSCARRDKVFIMLRIEWMI